MESTYTTQRPSAWRVVLDALRGAEVNLTGGSLNRAIVLLAIPMVLEMAMESVFAIVDIYFVSKLGATAVAVVGLNESLMTLVYVTAMGLGMGATAVVARRTGEGDADGAAHSGAQALHLGVTLSLLIAIVGMIFAPDLLRAMGGDAAVVEAGTGYTRVLFGGNVVIVLLFLVNAVFRGAGDAAVAMRSLFVANAVNIALCPLLIFGLGPFPELGLIGAAVATTIGRGIGVIYALNRLRRADGQLKMERRHLAPDMPLMISILRISGTGMLQLFIAMASWVGLVRIVSSFGSEAMAGYTIGIRVILFALMPAFGLSNAAATLVGQSLGAGEPARAERAVWTAALWNMFFLGAVGLAFILLPEQIVSIFTTDSRVVPHAVDCLRIIACGFLFYAYEMIITQSFNGAGDTLTPTLINFFALWMLQIPAAYILSHVVGMGPRGVYLAVTISYATMAAAGAYLFKKGKWKLREV
jgi:putative MATE family efflux protein